MKPFNEGSKNPFNNAERGDRFATMEPDAASTCVHVQMYRINRRALVTRRSFSGFRWKCIQSACVCARARTRKRPIPLALRIRATRVSHLPSRSQPPRISCSAKQSTRAPRYAIASAALSRSSLSVCSSVRPTVLFPRFLDSRYERHCRSQRSRCCKNLRDLQGNAQRRLNINSHVFLAIVASYAWGDDESIATNRDDTHNTQNDAAPPPPPPPQCMRRAVASRPVPSHRTKKLGFPRGFSATTQLDRLPLALRHSDFTETNPPKIVWTVAKNASVEDL